MKACRLAPPIGKCLTHAVRDGWAYLHRHVEPVTWHISEPTARCGTERGLRVTRASGPGGTRVGTQSRIPRVPHDELGKPKA